MKKCSPEQERIDKALEIAWQFSQIGGEHHKAWSIDQMVRALLGDGYEVWVEAYKHGEDGEYWEWDEGIAP